MEPEINPLDTVRELATHANDIKHLQDDMDKMVKDIEEIKKALQSIEKTLSAVDGGRKVFIAAISASSFVGGLFMWVVERFLVK